ncbi:MAG: SDR family NAD(P)-dependent oxidoreductase [Candidatus Dormibacteria bacterium]
MTGASRGIGREVASALAAEGARVGLLARSAAELDQAVLDIGGDRCVALVADVTDPGARRDAIDRLQSRFGPITILVNNAGIETYSAFQDYPESVLRGVLELNLVAPMLMIQDVLPGMLERGRGRIVNISSLAGLKGVPYDAPYSVSKFGLMGLTDSLRHELMGTGVQVSAVCPTYVTGEGMFARHAEHVKLGPMLGSVTPQRVARDVLRALRSGRGRVLSAPLMMRVGAALGLLWPDLTTSLAERNGLRRINRRRVELEG